MLKNLNQFNYFDFPKFAEGKRFRVTGCGEWKDFNTGAHLGTKVEVVITVDNTQYKLGRDGSAYTNVYEKLTFKVARDMTVPVNSYVEPVDAVATIYGERRNMLSIKTADIKVIAPVKE